MQEVYGEDVFLNLTPEDFSSKFDEVLCCEVTKYKWLILEKRKKDSKYVLRKCCVHVYGNDYVPKGSLTSFFSLRENEEKDPIVRVSGRPWDGISLEYERWDEAYEMFKYIYSLCEEIWKNYRGKGNRMTGIAI